MHKAISNIGRKFLFTESEWNPKVILGRTMTAVLPEGVLHRFKQSYYAYLLSHSPDEWREGDSLLVKHLVAAGDKVADIGSSIGGYTALLSRTVGPAGRVYSFEPNPPAYDFLSHNVRKLKLKNVKLFNLALSDRNGTASISIPRYRWGSECHYDATLDTAQARIDCRQVIVTVATLDSIFADRPEELVFIKCDVNNHELACLQGGLQTLRRGRPALLIEVLPDPDKAGTPAAQVFELLKLEGYAAYWFDGRRLHKRQQGERSQNYFFLTAEHVRLLPSELTPAQVSP